MNNWWCEGCARKDQCYIAGIKPKCFVPITNTASGTPKSYLAKSLRYSRDSHEIAKTENSSEIPNNCDTCKYGEDKHRYAHICNECGVGINNYEPKDEPTISKMEQVDEPKTQTETQNSNLTFEKRTMRDCYNCKRYETEGECIECHYEPKDKSQTDCKTCKYGQDKHRYAHICNECGVGINNYTPQTDCSEKPNNSDCEACELDGKADVCKICRVSNYERKTDCPWK